MFLHVVILTALKYDNFTFFSILSVLDGLDNRIEYAISKFACDINLGEVVDTEDVQLFRGSWRTWRHIKTSNHIKFKGNSEVLPLGRNNHMYYGRNTVPHVSLIGG